MGVLEGMVEFSVGSRNVAGGGLGFEWALFRQIMSKGATLLAWPIAKSTDPMSGFFCTTKEVLSRGRKDINPVGFKIGLEVAVRCKAKTNQDVAITFRQREAGESKLSGKVIKNYVFQLIELYKFVAADNWVLLILLFLIFVLSMIMILS